MLEVMEHVSGLGFAPETIIDVGVANGTFDLYKKFPNAFIVLIEPLKEFENDMISILQRYDGTYIIAAANSSAGDIDINVHTDHLHGSSLLKETMGTEVDGISRTIQSIRIDEFVNTNKIKGPYILKIDVQGAELEVLGGSINILSETELIIVETSMFEFMIDSPQFFDIVFYMKKHGFAVYDFIDGHYRPLDGALGQIDLVFVKEDGQFRVNHAYAGVDQWNKIRSAI